MDNLKDKKETEKRRRKKQPKKTEAEKIKEVFAMNGPDVDEPHLYEYSYVKNGTVRYATGKDAISLTKRQLKAIKTFGIRMPRDGFDFKRVNKRFEKDNGIYLLLQRKEIERIRENNDPELDKKVVIYVSANKNGHIIPVPIKTTLRMALLCAPSFNLDYIEVIPLVEGIRYYGAITVEEPILEKIEEEEQRAEENDKKPKITLKSIKTAIGKVLGKGKGER